MIVPDIDFRDELALRRWCAASGIRVISGELEDGYWGWYQHATRTIALASKLSDYEVVATLGHEVLHAANCHDGPQSGRVEHELDRLVASKLIDRDKWETVASNVAGLPDDPDDETWPKARAVIRVLQVPWWAICAYRGHLQAV